MQELHTTSLVFSIYRRDTFIPNTLLVSRKVTRFEIRFSVFFFLSLFICRLNLANLVRKNECSPYYSTSIDWRTSEFTAYSRTNVDFIRGLIAERQLRQGFQRSRHGRHARHEFSPICLTSNHGRLAACDLTSSPLHSH